MTLEEAHLELLGHVGEEVWLEVILPAGGRLAAFPGALRSAEQERLGTTGFRQYVLLRGSAAGEYLIGEGSIRLTERTVADVRPTGAYPGLDFTIRADSDSAAFTARISFPKPEGESGG